MKLSPAQLQAVALLGAALCVRTALHAQGAAAASESTASPEDVIIVREQELEALRLRIERAEDEVFARFNEINSDDSYDIQCYERVPRNSRIARRVCLSNAARAADTAIANATVRAMQGSAVGGNTALAQSQHAEQLDTERRVQDELRRLAQDDPILRADVERLGDAYRALNVAVGARPGETLYAELDSGTAQLPFAAQHLFEVRVGDVPWSHALTSRTFALANVQGQIRDLHVDCDKTAKTLDYKADAEWTIPDSWGSCTLQVSADRGTTFALYEFE
jgi:hypothetical protein